MSLSVPVPLLELISLAENPSMFWPAFCISLVNLAQSKCKKYHAEGLGHYSICYTDAQLLARSPTVDGVVVPIVRIALPTEPVRPGANAAHNSVLFYFEDLRKYHDILSEYEAYRVAVLSACGVIIGRELSDRPGGLSAQTLPLILKYLQETYGIPTEEDFLRVRAAIRSPFSLPSAFRSDVATLSPLFEFLAHNGQPLSELDKMITLEENTIRFEAISSAIRKYKAANPAIENRSFRAMVTYVTVHAHLQTAGELGYVASIHPVPSNATTTSVNNADLSGTIYTPHGVTDIDALFTRLTDHFAGIARGQQRGSGRGHSTSGNHYRGGRGGGRGRGRGGQPAPPPTIKPYCFAHGCTGHWGSECRTMHNDPSYTQAMKNATSPMRIDGYDGHTA